MEVSETYSAPLNLEFLHLNCNNCEYGSRPAYNCAKYTWHVVVECLVKPLLKFKIVEMKRETVACVLHGSRNRQPHL